jgi:hypothetical protein
LTSLAFSDAAQIRHQQRTVLPGDQNGRDPGQNSQYFADKPAQESEYAGKSNNDQYHDVRDIHKGSISYRTIIPFS